MLKHNKEYYLKFFLIFVILFFILTYSSLNRETLLDQVEVLRESGTFFTLSAVYEIFDLKSPIPVDASVNKQTYDIELLIHKHVNEIRSENGLDEIKWDPVLAEFAREYSRDMILGGFFNHTDPFGRDPTERAYRHGIRTRITVNDEEYYGIGENIAITPRGKVEDYGILVTNDDIASATVLGWMLSDPHRETILTEQYFFGGVGVVYDGYRYYYITHNFQ